MSITYTVEKKENALITHSVMETWECVLSEISSFICMLFFENFAPPLTQSQLRHCPFICTN